MKWKIAKNEKLNYLTVMSDIDTTFLEMNDDKLFNALADSSENGIKESKEFFKKFNQAFQNQNYVTTLTNIGNNVIDIVMTVNPPKKSS